ncbi:MAG: peptidase [Roseivirga sp.]|nr:peptidase [Roseivirga sp.]
MTPAYVIIAVVLLAVLLLFRKKKVQALTLEEIPEKWRTILTKEVRYFRELPSDQQPIFLKEIARFLARIPVNGVELEVTLEDRLLVASSAVIPLFGFPDFDYQHLNEVILYPGHFDREFNFHQPKELITGMVGNGPMEGKMILSRKALHIGFDNTQDKHNVGIHEFIHLYDKEDGVIDGIPEAFVDKSFVLPWLKLIEGKIKDIHEDESEIRDYGGTNNQEFLAVAGEYFFERPHLLQKKHPELYQMMVKTFNQDPTQLLSRKEVKAKPLGRNSPCPCGSGKKYKQCCLK